MEEAAEAQEKVCMIHYKQMEKADRDPMHALPRRGRVPAAAGAVPEQQVRAAGAAEAAQHPGSAGGQANIASARSITPRAAYPAAANRLQGVADQFPLYSQGRRSAVAAGATPTPRWATGFENQQASAYARIVREYPLSEHVDEAKARLAGDEPAVPEADPVAYARMKYELENRTAPA